MERRRFFLSAFAAALAPVVAAAKQPATVTIRAGYRPLTIEESQAFKARIEGYNWRIADEIAKAQRISQQTVQIALEAISRGL